MIPRVLLAISLFAAASIAFAQSPAPEKSDPGVLPLGADGKPLNLDFETGTLKDWTAEGEAFKDQPIKGDTVSPRRGDNRSQHQGEYWIGGYEKRQDSPQGTLTSVPFKVTHPWGSFLVGGGPHETTCVELVRKDTGKVFFRASGMEEENLRRVVVDLKEHDGQEIFIRIVDRHTGNWGHVNFDDFRFHKEKPTFAQRPKTTAADIYKHAGLKPEEAAKAMTVPDGFSVTLFAGEPDIVQPIAMCIDDRGRLWVAEAYSYPIRRNPKDAKDRILIFEDTDGDGKFDKRTVFMEGLNLVSGLEVGFGGVWIGAAPYLMFVPIKEGEDKPAGEPRILLDGWGYQDTHETLNAFIWGPDGWLYGCHGVFTHSRVGKPGAADKDRTPINAGVWRYHPTRHEFEVFAHGTSNPWGLDFNEYGHAFISACVIPHNWYIFPGGRYQRQAGEHFNPYTYADIPTIAEHRHYVGGNPHGGNGRSDEAGGGHAHCGAMIYLGGTWPKEYRGKMFMGNVHGHRINVDTLTPKGSGYTATRSPDFLLANDSWARFINLQYGPDGNVYMIDWYDKQACHHGDPNIWDRSNGRIYKISHKDAKPVKNPDLRKCSDAELVQYQLHENEWYVRHARRILQERAAGPKAGASSANGINKGAIMQLRGIAQIHKEEQVRLRALWTLHVIDGLDGPGHLELMSPRQPVNIKAWACRLAPVYEPNLHLQKLQELSDEARSSPVVRLALAERLERRLSDHSQTEIQLVHLAKLLAHGEDAADHNLPLMYWYLAEAISEKAPDKALKVAMQGKIPLVRNFLIRKLSSRGTSEAMELVVAALSHEADAGVQADMLHAINEGLKGRRSAPMPPSWTKVSAILAASSSSDVRAQASALAITFGDANALAAMRKVVSDSKADLALRQNALNALLSAKDKELAPILQALLHQPALRVAALKGLAAYDDAKTPLAILGVYSDLNSEEKRDALNTLASRAAYAKELLSAIGAKKIAPSNVSADIVRAMMNLGDAGIEKQIGAVWGIARRTPAEKIKLIAATKQMLLRQSEIPPDPWMGRAMFQKTCAQCHTLFGAGGKIGPDITGSNRPNLDYLLENILDPSAVIPKEYAVTVFELDNGRKITGIVKQETDAVITVQTANEQLTLPKKEIESRKPSDVSMMPDDILKTLGEIEFRSLIAYLQQPQQAPLLATVDNVKDFFNGKDLSGWYGDPKFWRVENGEIIGKSPGIGHNEFLKSHLAAGDFKLTLQVKLMPDRENSGVQFRSEPLPNGEVKGYQADVGAGWWGKLYEEQGRGLLWDKPGDAHVKKDEWNEYVIIANGGKVRTYINGKLCVDVDDPKGAKRGIFARQINSGGPMEVRYKDLKLELKTQK